MSTWIIMEAAPGVGLRVAVKDIIDVAGLPTTAGCLAVADRAGPAPADAACLAGLRAAAARGEAHLAYGSDTGGSIRIPAACCGVAGLKTTWGRVPLTGVWPLAPSLDTVGPMARDVAGLIAGMALLEPGFAVSARSPRVVGRLAMDADPAIDAAVDSALASAGWQIMPITLPGLDSAMTAALTVLDAEAWASDGALVRAAPDRIGRDVLGRLRAASEVSPAALGAARQEAARWRATLSSLWDQVELLALPTLLGFPPTLDNAREMLRIRGLTAPVNLAGVPALARPAARSACSPPEPSSSRPCGPDLAARSAFRVSVPGQRSGSAFRVSFPRSAFPGQLSPVGFPRSVFPGSASAGERRPSSRVRASSTSCSRALITSATGRTSFIRPTICPTGMGTTSGRPERISRWCASLTSRFCSGMGSGSGAPGCAHACVQRFFSRRAGLPL